MTYNFETIGKRYHTGSKKWNELLANGVKESEELMRIGEICLKNHVLVVSDEIHFDLVMPGYKRIVFASLS